MNWNVAAIFKTSGCWKAAGMIRQDLESDTVRRKIRMNPTSVIGNWAWWSKWIVYHQLVKLEFFCGAAEQYNDIKRNQTRMRHPNEPNNIFFCNFKIFYLYFMICKILSSVMKISTPNRGINLWNKINRNRNDTLKWIK